MSKYIKSRATNHKILLKREMCFQIIFTTVALNLGEQTWASATHRATNSRRGMIAGHTTNMSSHPSVYHGDGDDGQESWLKIKMTCVNVSKSMVLKRKIGFLMSQKQKKNIQMIWTRTWCTGPFISFAHVTLVKVTSAQVWAVILGKYFRKYSLK